MKPKTSSIFILFFLLVGLASFTYIVASRLDYSFDPRSLAGLLDDEGIGTNPNKTDAENDADFKEFEDRYRSSDRYTPERDTGYRQDLDLTPENNTQSGTNTNTGGSSTSPLTNTNVTAPGATVGECGSGLSTQACFCSTTNCYYNDAAGNTYKFGYDPSDPAFGQIVDVLSKSGSVGNNTQVAVNSTDLRYINGVLAPSTLDSRINIPLELLIAPSGSVLYVAPPPVAITPQKPAEPEVPEASDYISTGDIVTECMKLGGSYNDCAAAVDTATGGQFLTGTVGQQNVSYSQNLSNYYVPFTASTISPYYLNQALSYYKSRSLNYNYSSDPLGFGQTPATPGTFTTATGGSQIVENVFGFSDIPAFPGTFSSIPGSDQLLFSAVTSQIVYPSESRQMPDTYLAFPENMQNTARPVSSSAVPSSGLTQLPDTILNYYNQLNDHTQFSLDPTVTETLIPTITEVLTPTSTIVTPVVSQIPIITDTPVPPPPTLEYIPAPSTSILYSSVIGPQQVPIGLIAAAVMSETSNGSAPNTAQEYVAWMLLNRAIYHSDNTAPYTGPTTAFLELLTEDRYNLSNNNGTLTLDQIQEAFNAALNDCLMNSVACPERSAGYSNTLDIVTSVYEAMLQGKTDPTNGSYYFSNQGIVGRIGPSTFGDIEELYNWLVENFNYEENTNPDFEGFVAEPTCYNGECTVLIGSNQPCGWDGSCGISRPDSLHHPQ